MTTQCLISFGSNLGDRRAVITEAARRVSEQICDHSGSLRTSRLFETPPIGGPDGQSQFLNAVAAFETTLAAATVLDRLQWIETDLGRLRKIRWDARSIDLDVVLHGCLDGPTSQAGRRGLIGGRGPHGSPQALVVPHPRYTARSFVVRPACDVAADFCDPRFGWRMADLDTHLQAAVPSMALTGGDEAIRNQICQRLNHEHGIAIFCAHEQPILAAPEVPWISPEWPRHFDAIPRESESRNKLPRLVARIEQTTPQTRWPAPHQIWPSGSRWPEYRVEIDDADWAVAEIASALDSMCCPVYPITADGNWW